MDYLPVVLVLLGTLSSCLAGAPRTTTPTTTPTDEMSFQAMVAAPVNFSSESRIVGGQAATPGQFPHQVAMVVEAGEGAGRETSFCGGSILTETIVVTAAHCIPSETRKITVYAGANSIHDEPTKQELEVDSFIVHGGFSKYRNDIALVLLNTSLQFNERVQAIQLPLKDVGALVGSKVVMSGWGRTTTHGDISPVLRYVESYVLPNPVCQLPYLLLMQIDESHVCVSGLFKKGTCMGDSGGPLSTIKGKDGNATLVGITSFGMKYSCLVSWPPVFTRVASFLGWIEDGMEQLQGKRRPEGVKHLSRSTTRTP